MTARPNCECERGPVAVYPTLTDADGTLLDRIGLCAECAAESRMLTDSNKLAVA